jgi:hypothetical protein
MTPSQRAKSVKQSSRRAPLVMLCCTLALLAGGAWAVAARSGGGRRPAAPAAPRIHARPSARTDLRWALFTFSDRGHGLTFQCSLDRGRFAACGSRVVYGLIEGRKGGGRACPPTPRSGRSRKTRARGCRARVRKHTRRARRRRSRGGGVLKGAGRPLGLGRHTFRVRARNRAGALSRVATYSWTILTRAQLEALQHRSGGGSTGASGSGAGAGSGSGSGSGAPATGGNTGAGGAAGEGEGSAPSPRAKGFAITGQPEGELYPGGPALQIPLTVFNPNPAPIQVTSLVVSVAVSPAGCSAAENLHIVQSDVSAASPLTVAAGQSITLPTQGDSAPTIQFLNLEVNQDACKGASFPLVYSGSAHS